MKVARSPASLVSGTGERKTHLLPCMVIFCAVPDTTICAVCDCAATCDAARLAGLLMLPIRMHDVVTLGKPFGDIDGFFGLAGVVGIDHLDLLAANSAGGVLLLDRKVDGLPFRGAGGGSVAAKRPKYADLDRIGRSDAGRSNHHCGGEKSGNLASRRLSSVMSVLPWFPYVQF